MNDHEAQRIAAAMNRMRPDWPESSLLTLIRKNLLDRPRRDVAVALAWVACETNTATPARVLESGPWWRAAGIEGTAQRREVLNPAERCGICAKSQQACAAAPRFADDDHTFAPDFKAKRDGDSVRQIVDAVKAEVTPTAEPTERKKLDDLLPEERNPHVAELRAEATNPTPHAQAPRDHETGASA